MNDRALGENAGRGDDVFGPLLGHFLERPEIFEAHVLPSLSVKDLFALAGVNRAWRETLGEVEGMEWLRCHGETWSGMSTARRLGVEACKLAANEGRLEVLKWLRARG